MASRYDLDTGKGKGFELRSQSLLIESEWRLTGSSGVQIPFGPPFFLEESRGMKSDDPNRDHVQTRTRKRSNSISMAHDFLLTELLLR